MAETTRIPVTHRPANAGSARRPPGPSPELLYERSGGVGRVTLNRPHALNAYTTETLRELARTVRAASQDDSVGTIVLTGAGTQAFCTGGDVKEYATRYVARPHDYWNYMQEFRAAVEALLNAGKPTIARLNGAAVGGGNELHLACDLSIAASHAYLGQVGVAVGSVACGGATQWLPLAVGDRRARAMLLLNERVPADRALEWGLVTRVAPSVVHEGRLLTSPTPAELDLARKGADGYGLDLGPLDDAVREMTERLLAMFPECLRYTQKQTNFWKELAWHQTAGHGAEWLALHFATPEPHEGMTAFVEKRPARIAEKRGRLAAHEDVDYFHGPPTVRCPRCGVGQLPAGFRFCGACGAALVPPAPGGP